MKAGARRSGSRLRRRGIEQTMQVDDEIAHVGIADGLLRLRLPGDVGGGVVRVDADDVELGNILELRAAEVGQFTAQDQMQELFRGIGHRFFLSARARTRRSYANSGMRSRTRARIALWKAGPAARTAPCTTSTPLKVSGRPEKSVMRPPAIVSTTLSCACVRAAGSSSVSSFSQPAPVASRVSFSRSRSLTAMSA